ncbi:MAG: phosphatase PAP2 family protein [Sulfurimicrobium sp.]|nr:phosphatase PAP2 family protein [Sulfurimicrobium sp.]
MSRKTAWQWGPPLLALLLLGVIYLSGSNRALFLALNQLSAYSGDTIWAQLTVMGDTAVILALLLPWWRKRPDMVWAALLAALLATAWTHGMKPFVDALRPPAVLLADSFHIIGPAHRTGSFPSGHSTAIFTLVGVMVLTSAVGWLRWPLLVFAVLVAVSRSVVGVHWPLDLLGGMLGGWLSALGGVWLAGRWPWEMKLVVRWLSAVIPAIAAFMLLVGYNTGYAEAALLQQAVGAVCLALWALNWRFRQHESTQ